MIFSDAFEYVLSQRASIEVGLHSAINALLRVLVNVGTERCIRFWKAKILILSGVWCLRFYFVLLIVQQGLNGFTSMEFPMFMIQTNFYV